MTRTTAFLSTVVCILHATVLYWLAKSPSLPLASRPPSLRTETILLTPTLSPEESPLLEEEGMAMPEEPFCPTEETPATEESPEPLLEKEEEVPPPQKPEPTPAPPKEAPPPKKSPPKPKAPLPKKEPAKVTPKKEGAKQPTEPAWKKEAAKLLSSLEEKKNSHRSTTKDSSSLSSNSKQTIAQAESDYTTTLVDYLQALLILPEYGDVRLELVVSLDGSIKGMKVLSSKSKKNQLYLEAKLPGLKLPPLTRPFTATHTFTILLRGD